MNHHYGEMGDIWKHLPLAEILRLNPPRHYWETHAGSAFYPLTETAARLHGVYQFLQMAPLDPELEASAYLQDLRAMPRFYPGSPMLAAPFSVVHQRRESSDHWPIRVPSFQQQRRSSLRTRLRPAAGELKR